MTNDNPPLSLRCILLLQATWKMLLRLKVDFQLWLIHRLPAVSSLICMERVFAQATPEGTINFIHVESGVIQNVYSGKIGFNGIAYHEQNRLLYLSSQDGSHTHLYAYDPMQPKDEPYLIGSTSTGLMAAAIDGGVLYTIETGNCVPKRKALRLFESPPSTPGRRKLDFTVLTLNTGSMAGKTPARSGLVFDREGRVWICSETFSQQLYCYDSLDAAMAGCEPHAISTPNQLSGITYDTKAGKMYGFTASPQKNYYEITPTSSTHTTTFQAVCRTPYLTQDGSVSAAFSVPVLKESGENISFPAMLLLRMLSIVRRNSISPMIKSVA